MNVDDTAMAGRPRGALVALAVALCLCSALPVHAGGERPKPPEKRDKEDGGMKVDPLSGYREAGDQAKRAAQRAGREVQTFAVYLDQRFAGISERPLLQWGVLAAALAGGIAFWLFGWALLKTFFVPVVTFAGCATGGFLAWSLHSSYSANPTANMGMVTTVLGMVMGAAFYFVVGRKFKPLGMFLTVFTPFLIICSILYPYSGLQALAALGLGAVFAMIAMLKLRPVAVLSTSLLGAFALMIGVRLFQQAAGIQWILPVLEWFTENPAILLLILVVAVLVGAHIQLTAGPGDIEFEEAAN